MNKEISYTTHINENKGNRVEFWIINLIMLMDVNI